MSGSLKPDWTEALDAFDADWSEPILVAGIDATGLANRLARRSESGIAAEGDEWVLLAPEAPDEAPDEWADLPPGSVGTVILRRAWDDRPGVGTAAVAARRLLGAGGRLFAADLDLDRLLGGSPVRYPYQFRFTLDPDAARRLRATASDGADLALAVGRSGLKQVRGVDLEEVRKVYDGPADYWTAVRDGAWPSLMDTPADDRDLLLERLAVELERIAPLGEIAERRPWFAVTGLRV
jgi:hypothetical protein